MVKKFDRNGVVTAPANEFQMYESNIHVYDRESIQKYTLKNGTEKKYETIHSVATITVPVAIVRHLKLKNKDRLIIAIRKSDNMPESLHKESNIKE